MLSAGARSGIRALTIDPRTTRRTHSDAIFRNPRHGNTALHTRPRAVIVTGRRSPLRDQPHHTGISVPNLEESIAWYQKMLGFEIFFFVLDNSGNAFESIQYKRQKGPILIALDGGS